MPYQTNDPRSPFTVECPTCLARAYEPCEIREADGWAVWHDARKIIAEANADDLDPLDFQATITTRTVVGSAAPGDLSVFLDSSEPLPFDPDTFTDPQTGRNE